MKDAPHRLQLAMNDCLGHIGIEHAGHRTRAINIGERLEVLKDYPTSPGCTSPFAPIWITEMVPTARSVGRFAPRLAFGNRSLPYVRQGFRSRDVRCGAGSGRMVAWTARELSFRLAISQHWAQHTCRRKKSPMSTLMVDFIISLDGYAAAEGWPGNWGMEGPEYLAWIKEGAEHEPTALLVRRHTG